MSTLDNKLCKTRAEVERLRGLLRRREKLDSIAYDTLDWLVPGLLEEKVTALIRALPKPLRRRLVPAARRARRRA